MLKDLEIRECLPEDLAALEELYPDAFPEEDLLPLLRELLQQDSGIISLAALLDGRIVGHILFTLCSVPERSEKVAMLAPLAVASAWQKQGIGSALIDQGLRRMVAEGAVKVVVLGDPAYYGRAGFVTESSVAPPYPLPEEWRGAWQSIALQEAGGTLRGRLEVPQAWRREALWMP